MCLRTFRRDSYPNKYAYKIARISYNLWGQIMGFRGPYFGHRCLYKIDKTYKAKCHEKIAIRKLGDPKNYTFYGQYVNVLTGAHLYTKLAEAINAAEIVEHENPRFIWVVLKCDIAGILAYGDDTWGRTVVVKEVTPREVVWTNNKKTLKNLSK